MKPPDDLSSFFSYEDLGFGGFSNHTILVIFFRMTVAAILAGFIAYRPWRRFINGSFERPESGAQVLIAVAGGIMTSVVGSNTALAFALVGLGGFIRFRSGIKDPREAGVMFFMIGIGMACGVGVIPLALVSTTLALVLLVLLDIAEGKRRVMGKKRVRFSDIQNPRDFEPAVRSAMAEHVVIHGSKIGTSRDEVSVDFSGVALASAGQILALLQKKGIEVKGDVACEEL